MNVSFQNYAGIETLEYLKEAVNYNSFVENKLVRFVGSSTKILDFGAGNGVFAKRLRAYGYEVDCTEVDTQLSESLKKDGFRVNGQGGLYQKIYSLNVLEHIEDDNMALKNLYQKLESGGKIFIYVPAYMILYSAFDKRIGHFRRYKKADLVQKLLGAGFEIDKAEYADSFGFFAWLVLKNRAADNSEPSLRLINVYDKYLFPLSRLADYAFKYLFGKNLLVIASK